MFVRIPKEVANLLVNSDFRNNCSVPSLFTKCDNVLLPFSDCELEIANSELALSNRALMGQYMGTVLRWTLLWQNYYVYFQN